MLSAKKIHTSSSDAAAAYFAGYYAEAGADAVGDREGAGNGEPPGVWHGKGAQALGLSGTVSRNDLKALFNSAHPKTGDQLVRHNADRVIAGKERKAVSAYDLTFSAPKSVSTVWAAGSDAQREAITRAHEIAVQRALDYYQQHGVVFRTGAGGRVIQRGEPVIATFEHSTSRANDPQLHTHGIIFAVGVREDGKISRPTIDMGQIHAAGAVYRSALASELQRQGLTIERVDEKQGFFQIAGVPDRLQEAWSKRRAQIEKELERDGKADTVSAEKAAAKTRVDKENPDRASNFDRWREEARAHGFDPEAIERLRAHRAEHASGQGKADAELIAEAMDKTVILSEGRLARAVYSDSVGRYGLEAAQARFEAIRESLIRLEREKDGRAEVRLTTQAVLDREARIKESARALAADRRHGLRPEAVEAAIARVNAELAKKQPDAAMTAEQQALVHGATDGRGLVLVQGHAGAGKTFTMKPVVELYQQAGYQVLGASTSGKAAQVLGRDAGIEADTIARLKMNVDAEKVAFNERTVVIVDEAGMVSSADMDFVLAEARARGAKVILVGDTEQLAPVESGRPFEDLRQQYGALELSEVRRQKDKADREIGRALREGRVEDAAASMKARGQWHAGGKLGEVRGAMARDYADRRAGGHDCLMVAAKRADVKALNEAARGALRERGVIRGVDVAVPTEAGPKAFATGDRVLFRVNDSVTGTKNGTLGEVEAIDRRRMIVRLEDGERVTLRLDAGERLAKAEGKAAALADKLDKLQQAQRAAFEQRSARSTAPRDVAAEIKAREARKHEIARVAAALDDAKAEARRLGGEAKALTKLDHGHAITVHKSQGETVRQGEAIAERPELRGGGDVLMLARGDALESRQLAYVGATRNEGQAHVYLRHEDEQRVMEQFAKKSEKASVNDYTPQGSDDPKKRDSGAPQRGASEPSAPRPVPESQGLSEREQVAWEAREEAFWAAREAQREAQVRAATEQQRERERAAAERDAQLAQGVTLTPQERAEAQARGVARAREREQEIASQLRAARFVDDVAERVSSAARGTAKAAYGAARWAGKQVGVDLPKLDFKPKVPRENAYVLRDGAGGVDAQSFVRGDEIRARQAKEQRFLEDAGREAVRRERFEKEANRAWGDVLGEIRRLKTSADPLDQKRGAKVEAELNRIDELHKAGHNDYAKQARIDLARTCQQLRDAREPELRREDMKHWAQVNDEIAALRKTGDPRDAYRADVAEATLKGSLEARTDSEFVESAVVRRNLATELREQREERERREKGVALDRDRDAGDGLNPEGHRPPDHDGTDPKPESDRPKPRRDGQDRDDGHMAA